MLDRHPLSPHVVHSSPHPCTASSAVPSASSVKTKKLDRPRFSNWVMDSNNPEFCLTMQTAEPQVRDSLVWGGGRGQESVSTKAPGEDSHT